MSKQAKKTVTAKVAKKAAKKAVVTGYLGGKAIKKIVRKPVAEQTALMGGSAEHTISSGRAVQQNHPLNLDSSQRSGQEKRPKEIPVTDLCLDPFNPRLAEYTHTGTQASLLRALEKDFNLQPLADSLYQSGFFWEEPLVAVSERIPEFKKNALVIVEGNRRLAALKTVITNKERYPLKKNRDRLLQVPVIIRDDRQETLAFVGFRHITGVLQWESAAKAQYAHDLVQAGSTLNEIAQLIGDKTRDIARWIRTQSLVKVGLEIGLRQEDAERKFYFSYLLTATDAPSTKEWLEVRINDKTGLVESVNVDRLKKLWFWLFGSKSREISSVVPESRQIHRLNRVIGSSAAVKELEKTGNLDRAFVETQDPGLYVVETLGSIRGLLQDLISVTAGQGRLEDFASGSYLADAKQEFGRIEKILKNAKTNLDL